MLIGDNPVIVHDLAGHPDPQTPLFDALSFTLPMGPRVMVQVEYDGTGIHTSSHQLIDQAVDYWNAVRVRQATAQVYFRPNSGLETFVDAANIIETGTDSARHPGRRATKQRPPKVTSS